MGFWRQQLEGATNPARDAGWESAPKRKGFFTDTSICIGCKACEVACKEWNQVPKRGLGEGVNPTSGNSYDNSGHLGANTWRHVAFVEQDADQIRSARASGAENASRAVDLGMPTLRPVDAAGPPSGSGSPAGAAPGSSQGEATADGADAAYLPPVRWLMSSDVCKHCTHAACLDVCPTGALFRTEFGTVVVQADVCNGCGYCVAACPFGVIERRDKGIVEIGGQEQEVPNGGVAQKCTLCYDRISVGQTPACAQTCPTTSISYGDHDEMVAKARARLAELHAEGRTEARLYGANPDDGVGGTGSIFLLLDEPEVYGLPPDPVVTTADLPDMFRMAGMAGTAMIGAAAAVFEAWRRYG
ncbi:4Fe-4S dicluster domain-containing protein [Actinomycetota bacterium]